MKKLILFGKIDWSLPMSESEEEDFSSSSIDFGQDSDLEAEQNASSATAI